jgi:ABC-2 type transport system permease protein
VSASAFPAGAAPEALRGHSMNVLRLGLVRGWIGFRSSNSTPEGLLQQFFYYAVPLFVLIFFWDQTLPGTDVPLAASMLPAMLALLIAANIMATAVLLANEREDGTLLRAKAVPDGMTGYVIGLSTVMGLEAVLGLALVAVPTIFIVPGMPVGSAGTWLGLVGFVALGLLACLPLGLLFGSLFRNPRTIAVVGALLIVGLSAVSGLFFPVQVLWGWVQVVVQVFPIYWLGIGLRSAFMPTEAAALEIGGSWRTLEAIGVLGVWAAIGLLFGPVLLRRMARRESGSAVEARRQRALQRT